MLNEKLIVVGCDDGTTMSTILDHLKIDASFSVNVISATRSSDFLTILRSMDPDLVILCFRNNQLALSDFNVFVKKDKIPIFCITRKFENGMLSQSQKNILFTYPIDQLSNAENFRSTINSIFLLSNHTPKSNSNFFHHLDDTRNFGRYALELDQKVEVLLQVKRRITDLYNGSEDPVKSELTTIVNSIKKVSDNYKVWDDFKVYFEQVNPQFISALTKRYPSLTPIDLKYCCYLSMNMSNDDIKRLLGINQESVRTHKYRLKKKLFLHKDQDLQSFLRSVG